MDEHGRYRNVMTLKTALIIAKLKPGGPLACYTYTVGFEVNGFRSGRIGLKREFAVKIFVHSEVLEGSLLVRYVAFKLLQCLFLFNRSHTSLNTVSFGLFGQEKMNNFPTLSDAPSFH